MERKPMGRRTVTLSLFASLLVMTSFLPASASHGTAKSTPTISSVSPSTGSNMGGNCVTIMGSDLQFDATVLIGPNAGGLDVENTPTQLSVEAPAGTTGAADVTVTNPDGGTVTATGAYTYTDTQTLTQPNPAPGIAPAALQTVALGNAYPLVSLIDRTPTGGIEQTTALCGWGAPTSLGTGYISAPAIVSSDPGAKEVFARGTDNALWEDVYQNGIWQGWTSLGGVLASGPGAVSWGEGRIDVFVRGTDAHVWHKYTTDSGWSTWQNLGGVLPAGAAPTAASIALAELEVFVRGTNNAVYEDTGTDTAEEHGAAGSPSVV